MLGGHGCWAARNGCILRGGRPGAWHGQPRSGAACSTVFKGGGGPELEIMERIGGAEVPAADKRFPGEKNYDFERSL